MTGEWRELEKRLRRLEVMMAVLIAMAFAPVVGLDTSLPATAAAEAAQSLVR